MIRVNPASVATSETHVASSGPRNGQLQVDRLRAADLAQVAAGAADLGQAVRPDPVQADRPGPEGALEAHLHLPVAVGWPALPELDGELEAPVDLLQHLPVVLGKVGDGLFRGLHVAEVEDPAHPLRHGLGTDLLEDLAARPAAEDDAADVGAELL